MIQEVSVFCGIQEVSIRRVRKVLINHNLFLFAWPFKVDYKQNSRNTYIHIKQNIFALKELFYIQQLYIYAASRNFIYSTSRKWYTCLLSRRSELHSKNIYLFSRSIIIRGNYILSRNYIHFKELISSFKETYPLSRNTYSFREIISIRGNIFILKGTYIR